MLKICDRAIGTYSRTEKPCSFFDPNLPNGGPANKKRRRRYVEDDNMRYSETDALASINGITSGIKKEKVLNIFKIFSGYGKKFMVKTCPFLKNHYIVLKNYINTREGKVHPLGCQPL